MNKRRVLICLVLGMLITGCARPVEDGMELLKAGSYQEAIAAFEESIEKEKEVAEAYRGQGMAYWELGDYEKAEDAFKEALIQGAEETGTIYNFLGISALRKEDFPAAAQYFELGLRCEGNSPELIKSMEFNRIVTQEKLGNWATAKTKLEEYVQKYPEDAVAVKEAEFLETR